MNIYHRFNIVCLISLLGSQLFGGIEEISKKDFNKITNGDFNSIEDVTLLFAKSATDIETRKKLAFEQAKKDLAEIKKTKPELRTFNNTARAHDLANDRFGTALRLIHMMELLHPEESIRTAAHAAVIEMKAFVVDSFLNKDLYNAYKEYEEHAYKTEKISEEEQYYFQFTMESFKRHGLNLHDDAFEEVKTLQKQISQLTSEFAKNINDDKSFMIVSPAEISGCDEHFIEQLKKNDSGNYILKCDCPTESEVMKHCSVESTRKAFNIHFDNRAYPANKELFEKLITKRDALAKALGFASYAHLGLDVQMAKNPDNAWTFLENLYKSVSIKEKKKFDLLKTDLPEGVTITDNKLNPWDVAYTVEQYKQKHFNFDERKIAEYFPMEKTLEGIFNIYQKFLNLEFKKVKPTGLWHEDAFAIEVYKKNNGKPLAYILLDLYPRENKYSHAGMAVNIVLRVKEQNDEQSRPGVFFLIANFPRSTISRPSLLKRGNVADFFHEFGHIMHSALSRTEMGRFSGTRVKRDFCEVPSQLFEEWMWDKDMLEMVSSHYKTGVSLPDVLIDKMIALKRFDTGSFVQRQGWLGLIAFNC